ncbi:MAG: hypothetical protein R3B40_24395 [Polyangiales bacterium]
MSRRLRTLALLSLTALCASIASCGGGGGGSTTPVTAGPPPLVRLLDADTPVVVHVDTASVRQSPYYSLVHDALLNTLSEREQGEFRRVVQLLDRTDSIVFGMDPVHDSGAVLFRGAFEPQHIELLNPPEATFTYRTHTLRGDERAQGIITADTFVVGSTEVVHRVLDRLDGLSPATGPTLGGFAEAAGRAHLGERDASAVVLLTAEMRERMGRGDVEDALREAGLSFGGSLDARNGIRLSAFFTASSEGAVQLLARQLREVITEAQQDMTLAMLGLSVLLQQIQIEERGTDLLVEFHLDDAQVRELLERFGPLLQAVLSMT